MARTARQKGYRPYARAPASLTPSAGDVRTSVISNTHTHTNTHSHVAHAMPLPVVVVLVFFFLVDTSALAGSGVRRRVRGKFSNQDHACSAVEGVSQLHSCNPDERSSASVLASDEQPQVGQQGRKPRGVAPSGRRARVVARAAAGAGVGEQQPFPSATVAVERSKPIYSPPGQWKVGYFYPLRNR